jgi:hypothetical protein
MTTIHTRQLQQYTQDNSQQYTQDILKYKMLPRVVEGNKNYRNTVPVYIIRKYKLRIDI